MVTRNNDFIRGADWTMMINIFIINFDATLTGFIFYKKAFRCTADDSMIGSYFQPRNCMKLSRALPIVHSATGQLKFLIRSPLLLLTKTSNISVPWKF